jgi:hypothetical protein
MRICIDSCVFIHGLQETDPAAVQLLDVISPGIALVIPRLVGQEVTRNLSTPAQVRSFYSPRWLRSRLPSPRDVSSTAKIGVLRFAYHSNSAAEMTEGRVGLS